MYDSNKLFEQKTLQKGEINTLLKQLVKKIGKLTPELISLIKNSDAKKIDELTVNIFDVDDEEDVRKILVNEVVMKRSYFNPSSKNIKLFCQF